MNASSMRTERLVEDGCGYNNRRTVAGTYFRMVTVVDRTGLSPKRSWKSGAPMRTFLAAAVLLVATSSTSLAVNEFATAGDFVDAYHKSDELLLRLYIRGIGWHRRLQCDDGRERWR